MLSVSAALAACAEHAGDVAGGVSDEEPAAMVPGGMNPDDAPPVPEAAVGGASAERPCGDRTLAVVHHATGNTVTFCNLANGVVAVGETAPLGTPSLLSRFSPETSLCPRDVFAAVAPDRAIPAAIDRSCERVASRSLAKQRNDLELAPAALANDVTAASACNASGPTNFHNDHCLAVQDWSKNYSGGWYGTKFYYCIADQLWGWHDRWSTAYIGEGDTGYERVAACNGSIRFRAWWRWDEGDSWIASLDTTVAANAYYVWYIAEWDGGEDIDVRFRVDSAGGVHRHTGIFEDY
jgi:hypothetical protein